MRVALIGAGRMGSAMGARIAEPATSCRVQPYAAEGGGTRRAHRDQVADTAREAAESAEVCLVSLADDEAVATTYLAVDGLVAGLQQGAVVCDTSTSPRRQSAASPPWSRNRERP